ncbi:MAG TPA: hypothetical protein VFN14_01250 [Candidatus Limnocylindria bacterium]|nr:hypothetical protein [Candidatus Limnocylindria bacterium]
MNTLAPKLVLTPLLVASASLAGRRWGAALSGWLVALPLTSGPIAFFIAIEAGRDVAVQAAGGSVLGAVAQVAFAAVYTVASRRVGWLASLLVAALAFGVVGFAVPPMPPGVTYALLIAAVAAFLVTSHPQPAEAVEPTDPPAWDIPARVLVATVLVVAISGIAPIVGGRVSGILATFPVYAAVLATFGHLTRGADEATAILRGLATGLLGLGAFFLALGWLLGSVGIGFSFVLALAVGFAAQAATLPLLRVSTAS